MVVVVVSVVVLTVVVFVVVVELVVIYCREGGMGGCEGGSTFINCDSKGWDSNIPKIILSHSSQPKGATKFIHVYPIWSSVCSFGVLLGFLFSHSFFRSLFRSFVCLFLFQGLRRKEKKNCCTRQC